MTKPATPPEPTKTCTKCGHPKPLGEFYRDASFPGGRHPWCKPCKIAQTKAWQAAHPERSHHSERERRRLKVAPVPPPGMKRCTRCGPRPLDQFGPSAGASDGLYSMCRACKRSARRTQNAQRRARLRARVLAHYGQACACCGTTKRLGIDHVNGGGAAHRLALFGRRHAGGGHQFYLWLIRQGFPPGYQTLCRSCDSSKGEGPRCRLNHAA